MKLWKKALLILASISLMLIMAAGTAFADPWKIEGDNFKKKFKPKFRMFNDVNGNWSWAEQHINLMKMLGVIKGYENNTFKPGKNVTRQEAVVMIVRAAGLEDVKVNLNNVNFYGLGHLKGVSAWAVPYLAVAVEEGILEREDLVQNFNKPAKRYEVAVWVGRAFGISEKDEDEDDEEDSDDIGFKDLFDIPEWALGYVAAAKRKGIINGYPGNLFKPNQPISRAEMAAIMAKAGFNFGLSLPGQEFKLLRGIVKCVDDENEELVIYTRRAYIFDREVTAPIASGVLVYVDGNRKDIEDIVEGLRVVLVLDPEREAVMIIATTNDADDNDVQEKQDDYVISGIIDKVASQRIWIEGKEEGFKFAGEMIIKLNDEEIEELDDVEDFLESFDGYWVELEVEDNEVVEITIYCNYEIAGILHSLGENWIKIELENGNKEKFILNKDKGVGVVINDDKADLGDLEDIVESEVECEIELVIEENEVTEIRAEIETEVSGILMSIDEDGEKICVEVDGEEVEYKLGEEVDIEVDDEDADLDDLEEGYEVELELENGWVVEINAESAEKVFGKIVFISEDNIIIQYNKNGKTNLHFADIFYHNIMQYFIVIFSAGIIKVHNQDLNLCSSK